MSTSNQQYQGVQARIEAASQELNQVNASNQTVASHTSDAAAVAASAVEIAEATQTTFADLRTSSDKIGNVIEVIKDVAEQTNLLALNATIEAARAGDAGKGFAVVASEVKELSRQTSQAVDQVNERIAEIQTSAHKSIEANNNILDVIDRINGIQDKIAVEITEQDGMTTTIQRELSGALDMVTGLLQGR